MQRPAKTLEVGRPSFFDLEERVSPSEEGEEGTDDDEDEDSPGDWYEGSEDDDEDDSDSYIDYL